MRNGSAMSCDNRPPTPWKSKFTAPPASARTSTARVAPRPPAASEAGDRQHRERQQRDEEPGSGGPAARPLGIAQVHQEDRGHGQGRDHRHVPAPAEQEDEPARHARGDHWSIEEKATIAAPEQGPGFAPVGTPQPERILCAMNLGEDLRRMVEVPHFPGDSEGQLVVSQQDQRGEDRPDEEGTQGRGRPSPADHLDEQVKSQDRRDRSQRKLDHGGRPPPGIPRPASEGGGKRRTGSVRQSSANDASRQTTRPGARSSSWHRHRPESPGRTPGRPAPPGAVRNPGRVPGRPGARP